MHFFAISLWCNYTHTTFVTLEVDCYHFFMQLKLIRIERDTFWTFPPPCVVAQIFKNSSFGLCERIKTCYHYAGEAMSWVPILGSILCLCHSKITKLLVNFAQGRRSNHLRLTIVASIKV
jgi:hypothetical protein